MFKIFYSQYIPAIELIKCTSNAYYYQSDKGGVLSFSSKEKIANDLNAECYFAHPYSSWERGLNENTNGLVRQYLKKGSSFSNITDVELQAISDELNNRPRKKLGFLTRGLKTNGTKTYVMDHLQKYHQQAD